MVEKQSKIMLNMAGSLTLVLFSNLLDEKYEEILGFVRPGRAIYAGLRGRFVF